MLIKLNQRNFKKAISLSVKCIKKGGVVISPTDTVYGLVVDATNKKAVEKVFIMKKRSYDKKLPIFVRNIAMAKKIAYIDKKTESFLEKVWPGNVSVVLKLKRSCKIYGVGKKTVALRIPNNKFVLSLLEKIKKPLTGTSANISGMPSSSRLRPILYQFCEQKNMPDLIISSPVFKNNRPSSIISLVEKKPKVLRKGKKIWDILRKQILKSVD